ncbi:hypothetical protein BD324DRAFT_636877 [Kockovaella imperatae]|uniref:TFIIS N-terminal domain-containing protein n=1 Tax=Kockovaella imperatae TaxID=4999 RepID=A0A1Y1U9H2_9TREE|nr:hypothetical protein BD324DRAFT_636877 [Kockovaella imperatae]ORX34156.1 hypothetical protein BD324DRAFT_636877 [Kockovaella imperatae]
MSSPGAGSHASDEELPETQALTETQAARYDDIFGGKDDSDLSDLDEDENEPVRQPARRAFPPREPEARAGGSSSPRRAAEKDAGDDDEDQDDEDDVDDADEGDAYVPGTAAQQAKIPKFKKKARTGGNRASGGGDDDEEEEARAGSGDEHIEEERIRKKRRKEKKEKRRARTEREINEEEDVEESGPVYDEATQRRMALEERIDNIGKKGTKVVRRKRKGDDEDIVDTYHDDVCARLYERMKQAADRDAASNAAKQPATAKLAMLDEVMGILRNVSLWQAIVDNRVLEGVREWLEPIHPSGALPAVGIQKAIFEVLPKMDLDTATLKECQLGPIVLFYSKTKRVSPAINRQADSLVSAWSRPLIKRPANYRSQQMDTGNADGILTPRGDGLADEMDIDGDDLPAPAPQPVKRKKFDALQAVQENRGRKGARVLINRDIQYTVAPVSRQTHHAEDIQHVSRIQMDNQKFNKFARKLQKRAK